MRQGGKTLRVSGQCSIGALFVLVAGAGKLGAETLFNKNKELFERWATFGTAFPFILPPIPPNRGLSLVWFILSRYWIE